jgi:hypothetical protein
MRHDPTGAAQEKSIPDTRPPLSAAQIQLALGAEVAGLDLRKSFTPLRRRVDNLLTGRWHAKPLVRHAGAGDDGAGRAGDGDLGISDFIVGRVGLATLAPSSRAVSTKPSAIGIRPIDPIGASTAGTKVKRGET